MKMLTLIQLFFICEKKNISEKSIAFISGVCQKEEVGSYPTFKLYSNGKFVRAYTGGRTKEEFLKFMDEHAKGGSPEDLEVVYEDKREQERWIITQINIIIILFYRNH